MKLLTIFKPFKPRIEYKTESINTSVDAMKISSKPGRWMLVVGSVGTGKTTFVKKLVSSMFDSDDIIYVTAKQFNSINVVNTKKKVLIIDDLIDSETEQLQQIYKILTVGRHEPYSFDNIIVITQALGSAELKRNIPTEILNQFKIFIFFNTPKRVMKLQQFFDGIREAHQFFNTVKKLPPYHYIVFDSQTGYRSQPLRFNLDDSDFTIVKKALQEPLNYKKDHQKIYEKDHQKMKDNGLTIKTALGEITINNPKKRLNMYKIAIELIRDTPLTYKAIAELLHTKESVIRVYANRAHKRGQLSYRHIFKNL